MLKEHHLKFVMLSALVLSFSAISFSDGYSGGAGTSDDPYRISTLADLNSIGLNTVDYNAHFIVTNDIDMSAIEGIDYNIIGSAAIPFTGTFDGGGHIISHFQCDSTGIDDVGLFGWIGGDGRVSDMRLIGVNVAADNGDFVGAIAGQNNGLIQRCSVDGNISGRFQIGGIAGMSTGTIENSCAVGTLDGVNNIGGVTGSNAGSLENCYAAAAVPNSVPLPPKIYWTDMGTDIIQRADLDGTGIETLVSTILNNPYEIALDLTGGKMYWTDMGDNVIQRSNLDGSEVEDLVTTGLMDPKGIALNTAAGKMYWTDAGTDRIQRANLDGSSVEDVVTSNLSDPSGIALDIPGGKMYWVDGGNDTIKRANLNGSSIQTLISGLSDPKGIALDIAGGKMYWTAAGNDSIQRANLNGSSIQNLVTSGLSYPVGIAVDPEGEKIYWADSNTNKIQRANLDGGSVEDVVASGLNNPNGIVFASNPNVTDHSGGLAGLDQGGSYQNCFWDLDVSGTTDSAGGSGQTTAGMKTVSTFYDAGWDLMKIWNMEEGQTYPLLRKYAALDTNYDGSIGLIDMSDFSHQWLNEPSCTISFEAFVIVSDHWLDETCSEENDWCGGADLNRDNGVDIVDLNILLNQWLNCPLGWTSQ